MHSNQVHVCLEQAGAPAPDGEYAEGERYVCSCGANYVYREGFNRAGYKEMDWWAAPAVIPVPVPEQRAHKSLRDRLIRPRKG